MPKAGSLGPEHYVQATAPTQGADGDTWFDGLDWRLYDKINGWIRPGGTADLSSQISVLSQAISVISQQVSVLSQIHSALSQAHSVLSNVVSVISAGLGGVQMKVVGGIQGVSSTAAGGIAVSGLSASVAAAGIYQVEGKILYQMSAADAFGVALTFPAMLVAAGTMQGFNAAGVSAPLAAHFNEDASASIIYSAIVAVATSTIAVDIDAVFNVSAAGTIQVLARVSATTKPANIQAGSYLRAYKIA